MSRSCLIVGAGMAGLAAGRSLQEKGWTVVLFDKGKRPGGRMATCTFEGGVFDHGAQFFTVRDSRFQAQVDRWLESRLAREWFRQEGHPRYCGVHSMNALASQIADGLDFRCSEHVTSVEDGGLVRTRGEVYQADAVLLTAPADQSLALLQTQISGEARSMLESIVFEPCYAAMVLLDGPSRIPEPGYLRPADGNIAWIADNQQKGISPVPAVTIHATPGFTRQHWDDEPEMVGRLFARESGWRTCKPSRRIAGSTACPPSPSPPLARFRPAITR